MNADDRLEVRPSSREFENVSTAEAEADGGRPRAIANRSLIGGNLECLERGAYPPPALRRIAPKRIRQRRSVLRSGRDLTCAIHVRDECNVFVARDLRCTINCVLCYSEPVGRHQQKRPALTNLVIIDQRATATDAADPK